MMLRIGKVQNKKRKKFLKQTFEVSIKKFCRKPEEQTFPKWFFIFKQLGKCQNEYYPSI